MNLLSTALSFAERGFKVFPLPYGSKRPHPRTSGFKESTNETTLIEQWFSSDEPLNIGIVPGTDTVVLDVDRRHNGLESLADLELSIGKLPSTVTVKSGGGGWHFYFRIPSSYRDRKLNVDVSGFEGLDVKGNNGYLVGPGSLHPDQDCGFYKFADGRGIDEIEIATAPDALMNLMVRPTDNNPVPETTRSGNGSVKAKNLVNIVNSCAWLQRCVDDSATLPEPEWEAEARLLSHCEGGEKLFHINSRLDSTRYNHSEAQEKFERAETHGKPPLCSTIHHGLHFDGCKRCPFWGTINSPIKLAWEDPTIVSLQNRNVYDSSIGDYRSIDDPSLPPMPPKVFSDYHSHRDLPKGDPHRLMMNSGSTAKVRQMVYKPGNPYLIITDGKHKFLNTWRDTGCVIGGGNCDTILQHFEMIMPDEAAREYVLNDLAHLVRHPGTKIKHAWLVIGRQGTGKGFLSQLAKGLFGESNVSVLAARALEDRFNAPLTNTQVLVLEEMMNSEDRRDVSNSSKTLLTDEYISVEQKNRPVYQALTPRLIIATSNHRRPIHLPADDRRWLVIDSPALPRDREYYRYLYRVALPSEIEAFKGFLLGRSLAKYSPEITPPMTSAKADIIGASKSNLAQIMKDDIENYTALFCSDVVDFRDVLRHFPGYSRAQVRSALESIDALQFGNTEQVRMPSETVKRRLWIVRNHSRWISATTAEVAQHWKSAGGAVSQRVYRVAS